MVEWVTTSAFAARVDALMRDFHVPGLSIAVLDGDIVHIYCFGQASVEDNIPVDANTIFDIASCSKALTAVAMGILVDSHPKLRRLGWKTPVVELIGNDFVMHRIEDADVITVENLLSHTSGFSGKEHSDHLCRACLWKNSRQAQRFRVKPKTKWLTLGTDTI